MAVEVRELDLSNADGGYITTNFDLLRRALKRDKKYSKDLLYRGFDGKNIPKLLKTGRDSGRGKTIFAVTQDYIYNCLGIDPFEYAFDHENPAIAVFDLKHFKEDIEYINWVFKNPDKKLEALVAVYRLKI